MENILRNCAKHNAKTIKNKLLAGQKLHLIVNIDDYGNDFFRISIQDDTKNANAPIKTEEDGIKRNIPLVEFISKKIGDAIIEDTGEIRKGNWGIQEIKACVCFLRGMEFDNTLFTKKQNPSFIKASANDDNLQYSFFLLKPKLALLLGFEKEKQNDKLKKEIEPLGVDFADSTDSLGENVRHDFLLVKEKDSKVRDWINKALRLPYRIFTDSTSNEVTTRNINFDNIVEFQDIIISLYSEWIFRKILPDSKLLLIIAGTWEFDSWSVKIDNNYQVKGIGHSINKSDLEKVRNNFPGYELLIINRHKADTTIPDTILYFEKISGSGTLYNIIYNNIFDNQFKKKLFALQLIEATATKILIIDERLGGNELNDAVRADYRKNKGITILKSLDLDDIPNGENFGQYKFLLVHQGIIDKLTKSQEETLGQLKYQIPFFVIHTGRGRPPIILEGARYLEYSDLRKCIKEFNKLFLCQILFSLRR